MSKIKNIIKRLPVIGTLAVSIFRIFKPADKNSSSYWIKRYLPNEQIMIVQVGSNDGVRGDPINHLVLRNRNWNVLFVEPVPYLFERLKNNYGQESRFKFENSAINEDGSNQLFYSVKEEAFDQIPDLSQYHDQIGSFYREHLLKLSEGVLEGYIEEKEVNCLTLEQLFSKHGIESVDFLYIDAEGYDWKILAQLNLDKIKPLIIHFEYLNLSEIEKNEALDFLKDDYQIIRFRIDFLCIRKNVIKPGDLDVLQMKLVEFN